MRPAGNSREVSSCEVSVRKSPAVKVSEMRPAGKGSSASATSSRAQRRSRSRCRRGTSRCRTPPQSPPTTRSWTKRRRPRRARRRRSSSPADGVRRPSDDACRPEERCVGHSVRRHGYCGCCGFCLGLATVGTLCTLESHITSRASSELEPNGVPRDGFDRIGAASRRLVAEGGEGHTLALSVEGGVFVWGSNLMKQLGLPGVSIRSAVPELLVMEDGAEDRP